MIRSQFLAAALLFSSGCSADTVMNPDSRLGTPAVPNVPAPNVGSGVGNVTITGTSGSGFGGTIGAGVAGRTAPPVTMVTPPPPAPITGGVAGSAAPLPPPIAGTAAVPPPPAAGAPGPVVMSSKDPKIPAINGDCPAFKEGSSTSDFQGLKGVMWEIGPKMSGTGSLIFYWHGTGLPNSEYTFMMPANVVQQLKQKGGILVSPQSGTGTGGDCSGTATFAIDDFKIADQIAACAVKNWGIDPHRIYSTGCSAGGLQAGCMAKMRSSYLAAAVSNSGGEVFPMQPMDKTHIGAMMTIHGAPGADVVIVDFSDTSKTIDDSIKQLGGFAIDCNHGGGHCGAPADAYTAAWQFMQDHPFGYDKEPYGGTLPAIFPKYCKIW
jgi:hypothetical protein